jgi:hypothetical protein
MIKQTYTIEEVSNRDIITLKKSGFKFNIMEDPYDHTIKNAEFDSESEMNSALELIS